ncbi:unnamed protein product, partial [Effrenium voratum]
PIGNAMYRQFDKHPAARETYKWLSDDLKLRFRQTWALQRNFEFISKKRIRSISMVTSNQELGSWKNELQLEQYYGGVGIPEAQRQASNYIKNCKKWPDSTFTRYNAWTEADNFLLVEKLVSQTSEEAWREVAESVDNSATYALESYRAKACRKYAVVHGISYEAVDMEKVEKSSHGIQGWADMNVVVPGINEGARHSANPVMPIEGAPQDELDPPGPKAKAKGKAKAKPNSKRGGGKAKKEGPDTKDLEKEARESLMKAQRSQSLMENVCGTGADIPSEYAWTKSFLEEYAGLAKNFKDALQPDDGEDLLAFVNELKLAALSPAAMKTIKKTWGDKYHNMLTLFNDRMDAVATRVSSMMSAMNTANSAPASKRARKV